MIIRGTVFLTLLAGVVGGCNCDDDFVALKGALDVNPEMVDFGKIPVGGQGVQTLTLKNTGSFTLKIEGFTAGSPFIAPAVTTTIAPGRSTEVEVSFRPTEVGLASGSLIITTDDRDAPTTEVPVMGEGIEAAVRVEPLIVDFGEVLWVTNTALMTQQVTITNPGTDSFDLTALELTEDAAGAFGLDPQSAVTTFGPGDTQTFAVTYLPVAMGGAMGSVRIVTTTPTALEIIVTLLGTAVGPVMEICAGTTGGEACTADAGTPTVDFGPVALGNMSSGAIRILNTGNRELTVQGQLLGAPGEINFAPSFMSLGTFTIPAQSEQRVDVTYVPTDYLFDAVNVALGGNAAQRPSQVVPVRGEVPRAKIEVLPRSLNFRVQGTVDMTQAPIKIINCGTLDLTITQPIVVTQTGGPGRSFTIMNPPAQGTVIAPSSPCDQTAQGPQFMLQFAPSTAGQYSAEIDIGSDDPSEPTVTVQILGTKN